MFPKNAMVAESLPVIAPVRLNESQKRIVAYLEKHGSAKTDELVNALGISRTAVKNNLRKLIDFISWSGSAMTDPQGEYRLKK